MANNFAEAMQQGYSFGTQQRQEREQRNRLAELEGLSSKVISGDLDATSRAYALDPNQAKTLQGEGDRRRQKLFGLATSLKRAEQNPQLQAALYRSAVPYMRSEFGAEIPEMFDAASVMPIVEQVLAQGSPQSAGGPYADLPADIRSLRLLQEDPELAKLDRERRQAGGMVPKLVQTAQGYGWGTPGSSIDLAPMGGVAGQGGGLPQQSDMESDIRLANEMIAANIPAEMVDAFIASRGQRVQTPAASTQVQGGGIAQPYRAPATAPSGYRETASGGLEPIQGGPADKSSPGAASSDEQSMRKELAQRLKEDQSVLSMYKNVQTAAANPSAAGDLSMIFAFMKMLDPGSVVREQEFANAQNAAGVPDQIRNAYNRAMSGQRLNPNQRADFLGQAAELAGNAQGRITGTTRQYQGIADQYGFDPERATGMADFRGVSGSSSGGPSQQAARPQTEADFNALPAGALYIDPDDGRTYRKR